jgi:hypothetical protein
MARAARSGRREDQRPVFLRRARACCDPILTRRLGARIVYASVYVYAAGRQAQGGQPMQTAEKLLRKQFLIYPTQAKKIELIARRQKISAAEMVRQAIDAFDPDAMADMTETELLELVHARVKEAITETRKTRERIAAKLNTLEAREG